MAWARHDEDLSPTQRDEPYAHTFGAQAALPRGLRGPHGVGAWPAYGLAATEVAATIVNATHVRCVSPPRLNLSPELRLSLEISLNGHDFTDAELAYQYHAPTPQLQWTWPASDVHEGGRLVTVHGAHLANGSHYQCRYEASGTPTSASVYGRATLSWSRKAVAPSQLNDSNYSEYAELGLPGTAPAAAGAHYQLHEGTVRDDGAVFCPSPTIVPWERDRISPLKMSLLVVRRAAPRLGRLLPTPSLATSRLAPDSVAL